MLDKYEKWTLKTYGLFLVFIHLLICLDAMGF